ncbi:ABC transporter permease [Sandarakinorhabdus limnophila]|uniref:ABC transporter permease n=1 Tax=Sandarakinorhabdus limnophila TaxID=210512 RepID=UPI0026EE1595|nr:FtsX-like permease family protein [Sandarakinorhabdus limnophila]MCM0033351.1 FtsX-like permease family protein [Sandarakinorhabdus limnophila]
MAGLRILAVCLVLGVAALAGVGSLASAINAGLAERGQFLMGGDVALRVSGRNPTPEQRAAAAELGTVGDVVKLRGMVSRGDGGDSVLAEVKAVDASWPLYGRVVLEGGGRVGPGMAAAQPVLADKLGLKPGDRLQLGQATLTYAGTLVEEPDRAGDGFGFGPGLVVDVKDLERAELITLGSLYTSELRVKLKPGVSLDAARERLEAVAGEGGRVRDRSNGAPGTRNFVNQLGQFLSLVGLTALVVAGVGVAGGVSAYLGARTRTIATLKVLGADSATVRAVYLWQLALVSSGAVLIGLAIGAATPGAVAQLAAASLPVPPATGLQWGALAQAAYYGLAIALAFALWPLAEGAEMPAARLLRSLTEKRTRPDNTTLAIIAGAAISVLALVVMLADEQLFVKGFLAGAIGLIVVLWALAAGVKWLAARVPKPKGTLARLALANLHRPGAPTRNLVVALGLGLTLFATLATIEGNLASQINRTIPTKAPSFFVLDIPNDQKAAFAALVERTAPGGRTVIVPSLRGPVTAVNGVPAQQIKAGAEGWILRGDRGLSYAADFPEANTLVSGIWWPRDYSGPPLISLDDQAAQALGLKVGDTLSVSVLGVDITARIANTRKIDWQSLGFNFAILFAPGALEAAPHGWMATVQVAPAEERAVARALSAQFPTASVVRVKDVIGQVQTLLGQLSAAIRAAASVTVAAGIAVLVGALAAGARARTYDAVLLKLLGATRGQVAAATLAEYGLLAAIVSGLALVLGSTAGWFVVTQIFKLDWTPDWPRVLLTVGVGAVVTVVLGLAGNWRALSARPAAVLRQL